MAQIVSSDDMTVIVLDNDEASALADLLHDQSYAEPKKWVLDELTNAMLGLKPKRPILKLVPTEEGE